MYYLSTSSLILFFLFSLFHPFSCDSSKQEFGWCETQFQCGNITAGFPFSGGNRPQICGHPLLELHCFNTTTSIIISHHFYNVLHIDQTSNTLRLASAELEGSFCNATFTTTTLPSEIFELSSTYKSLTVFYLCDTKLSESYRSSYTCPGRGLVSFSQNLDYKNSCQGSFIINVHKSFTPEEKELNLTHLESALREGFEVKVTIDEKACKKCSSSNGTCGFENTTQICCREASSSRCNKLLSINDLESNECLDNNGGCWQDMSANITACKATFRGRVCECPRVDGVQLKGDGYSHCERRRYVATKAGIGAASALMGVIFLVAGLFCVIRCQKKTSDDLRQQNLKTLIPLKPYSYAQVKRITKSFAEVVGKGGFGTVYRGTLSDSSRVPVKILKDSKGDGEDFINEVASISKTSHVNIVTLLGFCSEGSKRAIIYEYLENGSLDQFISSKRSSTIDWRELYGIALGVARGLEYLHHGCRTRIVHFDIKPQNVLLDDNLCPKVSDFGLAKLCERKKSILSLLDTRGTIGYIAPEVFSRMYGRVSHKSDVYSYGMLLLEMIGARNKERFEKNSASNTSSMYFPEWIYKDLEKRDSGRLIENGITSEDEEVTKKMTLVGLWCIQPFPSDRPAMNRVVEMIEGNLDALEVPPRPVLQNPPVPLQESSTFSEDISIYPEV